MDHCYGMTSYLLEVVLSTQGEVRVSGRVIDETLETFGWRTVILAIPHTHTHIHTTHIHTHTTHIHTPHTHHTHTHHTQPCTCTNEDGIQTCIIVIPHTCTYTCENKDLPFGLVRSWPATRHGTRSCGNELRAFRGHHTYGTKMASHHTHTHTTHTHTTYTHTLHTLSHFCTVYATPTHMYTSQTHTHTHTHQDHITHYVNATRTLHTTDHTNSPTQHIPVTNAHTHTHKHMHIHHICT